MTRYFVVVLGEWDDKGLRINRLFDRRRAELWKGCHNLRCQRSIRMDQEKMAARFGRDQSTLKHELKKIYPSHCKRCKSMEWQISHISGSVVRLSKAMKKQQRMMKERLQKTHEASSKALQE